MDQKSTRMTVQYRPTPLERAFELARSGDFENVALIIRRLTNDGYDGPEQLAGPALRKQLRHLIQEARSARGFPLPLRRTR